MLNIYNKLHGVRRTGWNVLRKIDPLVFDEEVANNFIKFEREWNVCEVVAFSGKKLYKKYKIRLNLAGVNAILKAESFQYITHASREDSEVLLTKFRDQCMPTKTL